MSIACRDRKDHVLCYWHKILRRLRLNIALLYLLSSMTLL